MRCLAERGTAFSGVDTVWLAVEPLDMRSGTANALAGVARVFGGVTASPLATTFVSCRELLASVGGSARVASKT